MNEQLIREEICEVGRRLYAQGFANSNDGNISARISENEILVTPSGVSKGFMTPESIVKIDLEGNVLRGDKMPSTEAKMHLKVYQNRKDMFAVIHAHPPVTTAFAVCRKPLNKKYLPESIVGLGEVLVADYATPSTEAVPNSVVPYLKDHSAVMLANHGILVWDKNLIGALYKLQTIEFTANLYINVEKIGNPVELPKEEVEKLIGLRTFYDDYNAPKK